MVFYHCIRSDYYTPTFYCHRYDTRPELKECFESIVIPIPRAQSKQSYQTLLLQHLQSKINVHLVPKDDE